jgi:hypothetical protein
MTDSQRGERGGFQRHRFLSYQGYAFPWYVTLIWIGFFIGGVLYLVRNLLLG